MDSKRNDLEIIYNLQWRNPSNRFEKSNIIGMYDVPATTLNWTTFKSYLLKNSGVTGDDVAVSYVTSNNGEFPIESQTEFQIALYAFRRKARMGEIINLKLDRIVKPNARSCNDVQTQSEQVESKASNTNEPPEWFTEYLSKLKVQDTEPTQTNSHPDSDPPEWFINYMSKFKKEILDEVTHSMSSMIGNIKPHSSQPCYHARKCKAECTKRVRKNPISHLEPPNENKDFKKSVKLERKLEYKLEKLEHKTKKIKEKKMALFSFCKSSDSDAGHSSSRSINQQDDNEDEISLMSAAVNNNQPFFPHLLGGEVYQHQWEVTNNGKLPWTKNTTLNFNWGSKALKPLSLVVPCPLLKPGETGTVSVRLQIPNEPGFYECYWHFHHKGKKFVNIWVGCQVIVDPFKLINNKNANETGSELNELKKFKEEKDEEEKLLDLAVQKYSQLTPPGIYSIRDEPKTYSIVPEEVDDMLKLKLENASSSDSDNQSIASLWETNSSKDGKDFDMVPMPECFLVCKEEEKEEPKLSNCYGLDSSDLYMDWPKADPEAGTSKEEKEADDNNNSEEVKDDESQKSDTVLISLPNETEQNEAGYAYVIVDGHKLPIPKKYLKAEFLATAEEAPGPVLEIKEETPPSSGSSIIYVEDSNEQQAEAQEPLNLTASAPPVEAEAENRLFVFPNNCPGYEIVPEAQNNDPYGPLDEVAAAPQPDPAPQATQEQEQVSQGQPVHILPESLVSGAVNVASSAVNSALSVINMIMPSQEPGRWVNGHWVSTSPETPREANLRSLAEMGFWDRDLNATLLARYNDDLARVVTELVQ